eukprot:scaffold51559_cov31-Tisochrysis_lutea.AAC.2
MKRIFSLASSDFSLSHRISPGHIPKACRAEVPPPPPRAPRSLLASAIHFIRWPCARPRPRRRRRCAHRSPMAHTLHSKTASIPSRRRLRASQSAL